MFWLSAFMNGSALALAALVNAALTLLIFAACAVEAPTGTVRKVASCGRLFLNVQATKVPYQDPGGR